jgi:acid phosphatase
MDVMDRIGLKSIVALALTGALVWSDPLPRPTDPAAARSVPKFSIPAERPGVAYERFQIIGDMGTGRDDQRTVAWALARRAASDDVRFVLTVGDNIYPDGVTSVDDPQWKTKFEDMYAASSLQIPFYASLGNHDHRGSIQAQIDYSSKSSRWTMPAPYYTFIRTLNDETEIRFFALDTTPIHRRQDGVAAQLAWLDAELGKSTARWKIAFGHHPLYSHSIRGNSEEMIEQVESIFVKHGLDLYVAGHDHTLEMHKPVSGVHYVICGASAGPDKAYPVRWTDESYYAATLGGFSSFRVSHDECVIEFVRLDGQTQYAHTITKR